MIVDELVATVLDLLLPLGPVEAARLFGGVGLKLDGLQFAMAFRGTLYLRVDAALAAELKAKGSKPFKYTNSVRTVTVASYGSVPEEYLDDADQVLDWARRAVIAAHANPLKKKRARTKKAVRP